MLLGQRNGLLCELFLDGIQLIVEHGEHIHRLLVNGTADRLRAEEIRQLKVKAKDLLRVQVSMPRYVQQTFTFPPGKVSAK